MVNLHFHHVDPATKEFEVNMGRGKSLASFRREAAKCVLVCANCHGEIEAGLIPSPPPQARRGEEWRPVARVVAEAVEESRPDSSQLMIDLTPGRSSAV